MSNKSNERRSPQLHSFEPHFHRKKVPLILLQPSTRGPTPKIIKSSLGSQIYREHFLNLEAKRNVFEALEIPKLDTS